MSKETEFIQLYWSLYDSDKWQRLHWYSKLFYLRLIRNANINNKLIKVSYGEMGNEMTRPTVSKAIKELSKVGFVEVEQYGGLQRKQNYYKISNKWQEWKEEEIVPLKVIRNTITETERKQIFERDNWQCVVCGNKENLTIDHIIPFSRGGETKVSNLQTLCKSCNSRKFNKI